MFKYLSARHSPYLASQTWVTKLLWVLLSLCVWFVMVKPAHAVSEGPFLNSFMPDINTYMVKYLNNYPVTVNAGSYLEAFRLVSGWSGPIFPSYYGYSYGVIYRDSIYQPDSPGRDIANVGFVFPPLCPAHSTAVVGTPWYYREYCICDTPYVINLTTGSCVLEQYTIALSGLGGEVMPNATRAAYARVTKKSNGLPKIGAQVALSLTVVPDSGDPALPSNVGRLSSNGGSTGADGRLPFVFTAPEAGGLHTITATCTNCTNNPVTGTIKVPGCPIPPLSEMTDTLALDFESGNTWRPDLLTPDYQSKLECVEKGFTGQGWTYVPTNGSAFRPPQYQNHFYEILLYNDMLTPEYLHDYPQCQSLQTSITAEMTKHGLKPGQAVADPGSSHHESGQAFDISPILPGVFDNKGKPASPSKQQVFPVYNACGVSNTKVLAEKWHVE